MPNIASIAVRAKSLIELVALKEDTAAGAYFHVVKSGPKAVIAASCAQMFDMPFDCIDPYADGWIRRAGAMLVAVSPKKPTSDEIRDMVSRIVHYMPQSVVVIEAKNGDVEEFAAEIRSAHPEVLVTTCHAA